MVAAFSVKPTLRRSGPNYAYAFENARPAPPWLTVILLFAIMAVFVVEANLSPPSSVRLPAPNLTTLVALGGLSRALWLQGEVYRMIAAPFLHGNLLHLLLDGVGLAVAGTMLERLAGWAWTFLIFALGGLAGSATSLALLPAAAVSVGTSGGIMAVLSACLIVSCRLPDPNAKLRHQAAVFIVLALALLPLDHGMGAPSFQYAAHLGGVLIGGLVGSLLLMTWPYDAERPAMRQAAAILSLVAGLSLAAAAYAVALNYPVYADVGGLIPAAQYPQNRTDQRARANDLLSQYPRDPRAHLIAAGVDQERGDRQGAEYELRVAMTLASDQTATLFPALDSTIHAMLATTVLAQGRKAEAISIARPACETKPETGPPADIAAQLAKSGLCAPLPR
jgi:membrane associated rhomboid family serine protease